MRIKLFRCVSKIIIEDNVVRFEQKLNLITIFLFGIFCFILMKSKKNRILGNISDVKSIESSNSLMSGRLITVTTDKVKYKLDMRSKKSLQEAIDMLEQSELSNKFSSHIPSQAVLENTPIQHSDLGIASFIIAISCITLFLINIVVMLVIRETNYIPDEDILTIWGAILLLCFVGPIVGLILGISGWKEKKSKHIYAILGTLFNCANLLVLLLIIIANSLS
ncbi:hypothetical protein AwWohl_10950 [Gammaproteobacteria bacterium]|nr:hypothetical protein AwWohl_10950 [Gammaproteobacteria bacterium]